MIVLTLVEYWSRLKTDEPPAFKAIPAHPVTRGFLCAKVTKYLDRVYAPDRVLYPMRRVAPKGQGKGGASDFVRISWDEALSEIKTRFEKISAEFGPEAILPYSYAGNMGMLSYAGMSHRFFYRLGASQLNRTICASAGGDALVTVYGRRLGHRAGTIRGIKVHHCLGRQHSRQQRSSLAVY